MPHATAVAVGEARDSRPDALLQRMPGVEVGLERLIVHPAVREEARVLAGAVVMQGGPLGTGRRRRFGGGEEARRVAAALQLRYVGAGFRQDALDDGDVHRLAAVARAHQRQFVRRETVALHAAVLDERQRLQGLQRRAGEIERVGIPDGGDQPAGRIGDGDRSVVHALRGAAAGGFDQRDVARNHQATPRDGAGEFTGRPSALRAPERPRALKPTAARRPRTAAARQSPCDTDSDPGPN